MEMDDRRRASKCSRLVARMLNTWDRDCLAQSASGPEIAHAVAKELVFTGWLASCEFEPLLKDLEIQAEAVEEARQTVLQGKELPSDFLSDKLFQQRGQLSPE